jgi:hypothetical protein
MRGIAGRRPRAAAINLEVIMSARITATGNEELSEEPSQPTKGEDSKEEERFSLSKALFDEHKSWAGLTIGSQPIQ